MSVLRSVYIFSELTKVTQMQLLRASVAFNRVRTTIVFQLLELFQLSELTTSACFIIIIIITRVVTRHVSCFNNESQRFDALAA
jgi:hypothetical protein